MIEILRRQIEKGGYKLSEMTRKLSVLYTQGQIEEELYNQMLKMASENANPDSEMGNILTILKIINSDIEQLKNKVYEIEKNLLKQHDDTNPEDQKEPEVEQGSEYPEWQPWNGIPGSGYKKGSKVTHNGKKYESKFVGVNVWEPGLLGTETLWVEVV